MWFYCVFLIIFFRKFWVYVYRVYGVFCHMCFIIVHVCMRMYLFVFCKKGGRGINSRTPDSDMQKETSQRRWTLCERFFSFHWHAMLSTNRMEIDPHHLQWKGYEGFGWLKIVSATAFEEEPGCVFWNLISLSQDTLHQQSKIYSGFLPILSSIRKTRSFL